MSIFRLGDAFDRKPILSDPLMDFVQCGAGLAETAIVLRQLAEMGEFARR